MSKMRLIFAVAGFFLFEWALNGRKSAFAELRKVWQERRELLSDMENLTL